MSIVDRPSLSETKMTEVLIKNVSEGDYSTKEYTLGDQSVYIAVESTPASANNSLRQDISTLEDANVAPLLNSSNQ